MGVWGWNWICLRKSDHWLREEPQLEAAAVLLRYPRLRPVRGHGTVLFDDGFPPAVCILRYPGVPPVILRHLAMRGLVLLSAGTGTPVCGDWYSCLRGLVLLSAGTGTPVWEDWYSCLRGLVLLSARTGTPVWEDWYSCLRGLVLLSA